MMEDISARELLILEFRLHMIRIQAAFFERGSCAVELLWREIERESKRKLCSSLDSLFFMVSVFNFLYDQCRVLSIPLLPF